MGDGTGATRDDTPGAGNVSDETPPVSSPAASNVTNSDSTHTPASTQRHDTPGGTGFDVTKLTDRIDSLPESIANAVKEVLSSHTPAPAPQTTAQASDNSTDSTGTGSAGTSDTGDGASQVKRHERFASWWFGK